MAAERLAQFEALLGTVALSHDGFSREGLFGNRQNRRKSYHEARLKAHDGPCTSAALPGPKAVIPEEPAEGTAPPGDWPREGLTGVKVAPIGPFQGICGVS